MFFIQYTAAVITLDSELQERSSNMGGWVSQNTHICVKHNGDEKPEKKKELHF